MAAVTPQMNEGNTWLQQDGRGATKEEKIEKWWEVNRKHDPPLTRGATPLVERCMRVHGFSENFSRRVLKGYRQFMELKSVMNDWQGTKLTAPLPIQQMWEQHLVDNLNYTDDCFLLFGRVIGNDPDAILDMKGNDSRVRTTKIAFQARYGDDLDPEVWAYHSLDDNERVMIEESNMSNMHIAGGSISRGRLPVAGLTSVGGLSSPGPAMERASLSPRGRSLVQPSDSELEEQSPMTVEGRGRKVGASSPRNRSSSKNPPKSPTGNDPITIFLRDQATGEETYFSLRYRSTLRIVFTVFAERKSLNQESLKFGFNGQTLTGYETPYSLGLEDRARIDVSIVGRRN